MRVSSYAVARPSYYDRNSTSVLNTYYAAVAPHGVTQRWNYTVAAGKKLLVEIQTSRIARASVATVAGLAYTEIIVASGAANIITQSIQSTDNTITVATYALPTQSHTIYASENLTSNSYDTSTGGTITFHISSKGTLFDA